MATSRLPRPEYPRPQFVRKDWLCLNGQWQFEIDHGDSGLDRGLKDRTLAGTITVPFCPESKLGGVENVDFMNCVWYRRSVRIPGTWAGRTVLLHFGAVDYEATVWVNGKEVGRHRGGSTPFTCDLSGVAEGGQTATIVVRARDLKVQPTTGIEVGKPSGKQSNHCYHNAGCHYTRTTGIWQTVWMEPVPTVRLDRPRITPDVANGCFHVTVPMTNSRPGTRVRVTLADKRGAVAKATIPADADFTPTVTLAIPASRRRLWSPEDPFLFDLQIDLLDAKGKVIDSAASYAGLRSVTIDGLAVKINGRPVFQRLVLDQGYYPDGILTAPTDKALADDIKLSMAAGFNGARLHQKIFEERFLYHADRLGYLVWGEFPDWGCDRAIAHSTYITQWLEELHRDYSHPSLVGWCALNETVQAIKPELSPLDDLTLGMFLAAKAMDPTRPVLDTSGYSHRVPQTDVYDSHDYDQKPETLAQRHAGTSAGSVFVNAGKTPDGKRTTDWSVPYRGQPYFVSEFGGTWWNPDAAKDAPSWGYGDRPKTIEEFYDRFEKLCGALLDNPGMFAYCYTQLTDVFQEQNGIYHFDRKPKFDARRLRKAQQRIAAIENKSTRQ